MDVALVHNVGDAMARTDQFPVAIVDVHLPDGSGLDLFRRLHEQGRVKKSVFFTATESEDERLDAKACGTLVSKSEGVDRAVAEALELARSEQSGPELP